MGRVVCAVGNLLTVVGWTGKQLVLTLAMFREENCQPLKFEILFEGHSPMEMGADLTIGAILA